MLTSFPLPQIIQVKEAWKNLEREYGNPIGYDFEFIFKWLNCFIDKRNNQFGYKKDIRVYFIYDDIWSLDVIFGILRNLDVWYAKCSEIAHYHDSYTNATVRELATGVFSAEYAGIWDNMLLSIKSDCNKLLHIETGKKFKGLSKNGSWVFNNIPVGNFRMQ